MAERVVAGVEDRPALTRVGVVGQEGERRAGEARGRSLAGVVDAAAEGRAVGGEGRVARTDARVAVEGVVEKPAAFALRGVVVDAGVGNRDAVATAVVDVVGEDPR